MSTTMLKITGLKVAYGGIQAVKGVSFEVREGELVSLIGANGAGKTTTLKAAGGVLPYENGRIAAGRIRFFGDDIVGKVAYQLARSGLAHVREGRHIFADLTVEEDRKSVV